MVLNHMVVDQKEHPKGPQVAGSIFLLPVGFLGYACRTSYIDRPLSLAWVPNTPLLGTQTRRGKMLARPVEKSIFSLGKVSQTPSSAPVNTQLKPFIDYSKVGFNPFKRVPPPVSFHFRPEEERPLR